MLYDRDVALRLCRQPDERTAFARVLDLAAFCAKNHEPTFSGFLDAHHVALFMEALADIGEDGLQAHAFGGFPEAERQMIGFWQDYAMPGRMGEQQVVANGQSGFCSAASPAEGGFPIVPLRLRYDAKFAEGLGHRDFLGATLGAGVSRAMVGDVMVSHSQTIIFVQESVADYLSGTLDKVKRLRVEADVCPPEELFVFEVDRPRTRLTVASLRLDAVASAVFRLSRSKLSELVRGGKVLVNWTAAKAATTVDAGDMITIRGMGRAKVVDIEGETKKERLAIVCERY